MIIMENVVRKIDVGLWEIVVSGEVRRIIRASMKDAVMALLAILRKESN